MEAIDKIFELIDDGRNLFITGGGGCGKSYNLSEIKKEYDIVITSTTGISALKVGGVTVHSWAGVGRCDIDIDEQQETLENREWKVEELRDAEMLAIDEISMLSADAFEYIDEMLRRIRECDEPFGGLQVILVGDFFQLPPVSKGPVKARYAFESPVWEELNLANVVLKESYRQKDDKKLVGGLNNIRTGNITPEQIQMFMSRNGLTPDDECVRLYSTNDAVKQYNLSKLKEIKKPVVTYYSENWIGKKFQSGGYTVDYDDIVVPPELKSIYDKYRKSCKYEEELHLKEGCRVMLLYNLDATKGLVNGSTGRVIETYQSSVLVRFDNGCIEEIEQEEDESIMDSGVIIRRTQIPLKLAYAVTIHKSQGQTYNKVYVDLNKIFAAGQTYVALSRVTSLEGLFLDNFYPRKIMADPKVVQFYKELKSVI